PRLSERTTVVSSGAPQRKSRQSHQGRIDVTSTIGKETTFAIILPLKRAVTRASAHSNAPLDSAGSPELTRVWNPFLQGSHAALW
ncbi:MAG: hypothetical protein WA477_21970, partial [Candidatus Sulfotelmatobacter sp.]